MNIDTLIIEIYCRIEKSLRGIKLRSRGFPPKLTDAELITMEIIGHLMHQNCTEWIYRYFKTHWQDWFPKLGSRANFMKQSCNLSFIKQRLIKDIFPPKSNLHIIDGMPLPICKYARSSRCQSLEGHASYGYCAAKDEYYYGLKAHMMIDDKNLITFVTLTSASTDERDVLYNLCGAISGHVLGDKDYISQEKEAVLRENDIKIHTLKRQNMKDDRPKSSKKFISKTRKMIETTFSILTETFDIAHTKARSIYSYSSKIAAKILVYNFQTLFNH
ncbi:MAG: hypothetical protein ACJARD_001172 [Alphaproteobacteria bacterium]|jgi:hypothetical protein